MMQLKTAVSIFLAKGLASSVWRTRISTVAVFFGRVPINRSMRFWNRLQNTEEKVQHWWWNIAGAVTHLKKTNATLKNSGEQSIRIGILPKMRINANSRINTHRQILPNRPCVSKICRNTPKTSTIRAKNVSLIFVDMKTSTIVRKIWTGWHVHGGSRLRTRAARRIAD